MPRKKAAPTEPQTVLLPKTMATVIEVLEGDRQRIIADSNKRLQEIGASIEDTAKMYAAQLGMPQGWLYSFKGTEDGVQMIAEPPPPPPEEPEDAE